MILTGYLLRTLLTHMLTVQGVLLALFALFNFLEQLDDVGQGRYTLLAAIVHSLLLVPTWLMEMSPVAAFLGAMSGLGRLQQDSEITVMRASGWSTARISGTAFLTAVLLSVTAGVIGE